MVARGAVRCQQLVRTWLCQSREMAAKLGVESQAGKRVCRVDAWMVPGFGADHCVERYCCS